MRLEAYPEATRRGVKAAAQLLCTASAWILRQPTWITLDGVRSSLPEAGRRRAGEGDIGAGGVRTTDVSFDRAFVARAAELARGAEAGRRRAGKGDIRAGAVRTADIALDRTGLGRITDVTPSASANSGRVALRNVKSCQRERSEND